MTPVCAHHQHPGQRRHAQQVVEVEPLGTRRLVVAHRAERQLAHEGRVENGTRDDRGDEQQSHEAQEQGPRHAGEHVDVQREHHVHEAGIVVRLLQQIAGAAIEGEDSELIGQRLPPLQAGVDQVRVVLVPDQVFHLLARIETLRRRDDRIGPDRRCIALERGQFGHVAAGVVDLLIEDDRQPGDAQHQQEQGADEACPLVYQVPGFDRPCPHASQRPELNGTTYPRAGRLGRGGA
jgi:hypothetical protein